MQRHSIKPRRSWQRLVTKQGLTWHSVDGDPYWDESAYWEFTAVEIDRLEAATAELQQMCLAAGKHILKHDRLAEMHITGAAEEAIRRTWEDEPPALYGRMDLAYDGRSIKLLEYNADTPTSLLEASVIQWRWLEDCFPKRDQWNSIHEKLVAKWKDLRNYVRQPVYFAHDGHEEDALTVAYLRDTAQQASVQNESIRMRDLGWDRDRKCFVNLANTPIETIFKLYPWEALLGERFGLYALDTLARGQHPEPGCSQWIEPIWKMMWSNKALLAILWELYPYHDLLLPANLDGPHSMSRYVRKPIFGREGANVSIVNGARSFATEGAYSDGPWVYQGLAPVACVDGNYAVLGSWLIDGEAAGLGIRESRTPVIRNVDRFVPHLF